MNRPPPPLPEEALILDKPSRAILFANGIISAPIQVRRLITSSDLLIAADGGTRHMFSLGLLPKVVIGDFDSLTSVELHFLQSNGTELLHYPTEKDETDLELALGYVLNQDIREVVIFGALGGRWDMTFANLLLLAHNRFSQLSLRIVEGMDELFLLRSGQSTVITGLPGDTVSLLPLSPEAIGIRTEDLQYPLFDDVLTLGSPRGVSNVMLTNKAVITLKSGMLLCIHTRKVKDQSEFNIASP